MLTLFRKYASKRPHKYVLSSPKSSVRTNREFSSALKTYCDSMPYSSKVFDKQIQEKFTEWNYLNYLDVGAGAGKYGRMIKAAVPQSRVSAVEVDAEYISRFGLESIYGRILNIDVRSLPEGDQDTVYDVVVFGDVIEHLPKSAGVDLIHFFSYRCKKMIIVYPTKYIQYSVEGKTSESHRSVWAPADFSLFNCEHHSCAFMNLTIVDGFLGDPSAIIPNQ